MLERDSGREGEREMLEREGYARERLWEGGGEGDAREGGIC